MPLYSAERIRQAPRIKDTRVPSASKPNIEPSSTPRESHAVKIEAPKADIALGRPGSSYPAIKNSTIDVDVKPTYKPTGKVITDMDMDAGISFILLYIIGSLSDQQLRLSRGRQALAQTRD